MENNKKEFSAKEWYIEKRPTYKKMAEKVASIILEVLNKEGISYYTISNRAKDIESFVEKSKNEKYNNPQEDIMDMAGIRIITYVKSEVYECRDAILPLFDIDYENSVDKTEELGEDKVGYISVHYIAKFKKDRLKLPEYKIYKDLCFEIQIRTILEHAWADISHDRNYKFTGTLPKERDIRRRFSLASATLEMVDREFDNLVKEIDTYKAEIIDQMEKNDLDISINTVSLSNYLSEKFSKQIQSNNITESFNNSGELIVEELNLMGIDNLSKLDTIIEKKMGIYIEDKNTNFLGLLRTVMMVYDANRYFEKAWRKAWGGFSGDHYEFLQNHVDNIADLAEKYNLITDGKV